MTQLYTLLNLNSRFYLSLCVYRIRLTESANEWEKNLVVIQVTDMKAIYFLVLLSSIL